MSKLIYHPPGSEFAPGMKRNSYEAQIPINDDLHWTIFITPPYIYIPKFWRDPLAWWDAQKYLRDHPPQWHYSIGTYNQSGWPKNQQHLGDADSLEDAQFEAETYLESQGF